MQRAQRRRARGVRSSVTAAFIECEFFAFFMGLDCMCRMWVFVFCGMCGAEEGRGGGFFCLFVV